MPAHAGKPSVIVIGAGFGGLGAAIELTRAGFPDVTILERAHELGGVWRENTYPGAGCDVPSPLYSYSFEPNPQWPRRFSMQSDIHAYMKAAATKYGLDGRIQYGTEVSSAEFDAEAGRWRVRTTTGEQLDANVLVPAVGQLSRPSWPNIAGIDSFRGPAFHSALWDHELDLTGKRVAVIGTGASAIQFVPQIQPGVAHLDLFQRTPPYIAPKLDKQYSPRHHRMFDRLPVTQRGERFAIWTMLEVITLGMTRVRPLGAVLQWICLRHLRSQVTDPVLLTKLTPDYPAGCKRVLFSDTYLPALAQPNVDVITESVSEITPDGVRTADGVEHPADVIIYGTGFAAKDFLAPITICGVDGRDLQQMWAEGARAYLGMALPGFPNMFLMYGPNTNLGAGSIIYMLEAQARYIRQAVERIARAGPAYLEVRPEVEARYDDEVQARASRSVWSMCTSWYRNANGRVVTNWPGLVSEYYRRTKRLDDTDFQLTRIEAAEPRRLAST